MLTVSRLLPLFKAVFVVRDLIVLGIGVVAQINAA